MFSIAFPDHFKLILSGPSGCGKTTHALDLLRNKACLIENSDQKKIFFFYKEWQSLFEYVQNEGIIDHWINNMPEESDIRNINLTCPNGAILVIDDFAFDMDKTLSWLFAVGARHNNCSVIMMTQNLFVKNQAYRDASLNATHVAIFKTLRDTKQIEQFCHQVASDKWKSLAKAYALATKRNFGYLYFDFTQATEDFLRFRSNILPKEAPVTIYKLK